MMKNIQKVVFLVGALCAFAPRDLSSAHIWDRHQKPASFSSIIGKSFAGGGVAAVLAAVVAASMFPKNSRLRASFIALLAGGFIGGGLTYASCRKNTPEEWLSQFFSVFNQLSASRSLADSNLSNAEWTRALGSVENLERELCELRKHCVDIDKLQRVVYVLLAMGLDEFRPETLVDLRANKERLEMLSAIANTRRIWVATTLDYENFQKLYARIRTSAILAYGSFDSLDVLAGGQRSFKQLKGDLADLLSIFTSLDGVINRLTAGEALSVLTVDQQAQIMRTLPRIARRKQRCESRLAYASARVEYEDFNQLYNSCLQDSSLKFSGLFGNDDAWMMTYGVRRNLYELKSHLKRRSKELKKAIDSATGLTKTAFSQYFSNEESSELVRRIIVSREFLALCDLRLRMVNGMQKVDDFVEESSSCMANRLVQESVQGSSDLSWMQATRGAEWPLEDICSRLRALKSELTKTLQHGQSALSSSDVQLLSEARRNIVRSRIEDLRRAINLVDRRLTFVLHSTMYAEEVAKKRSLQTYQQEQLERERRAREEALNREIEQRAKEREQLRAIQNKKIDDDLRNHKNSQVSENNKKDLESCFCGDDIQRDDMYKLACPCKDSFYHKNCITRWVALNKSCPTCRACVSLADVKKYEKPIEREPDNNPSTAQPAQGENQNLSAPTEVREAEECYLCMDSDNVADCTTANCDCTVKKPACRECLQSWLSARHTCPRCQKTGATLVPYVA